MIFLGKTRENSRQLDEHWNCREISDKVEHSWAFNTKSNMTEPWEPAIQRHIIINNNTNTTNSNNRRFVYK